MTANTHDAWVDAQNAAITEFARFIIPTRVLEQAEAGDYLARELVAGDVAFIARLEALSDEELAAEYASNQAAHLRVRELDDNEYDINDHESHYYVQWVIEELRIARDVAARYTTAPAAPLTYRLGDVAA